VYFLVRARQGDTQHGVVLAGSEINDLPCAGQIGRQLIDPNRFDEYPEQTLVELAR
jgi:hypothetical protein